MSDILALAIDWRAMFVPTQSLLELVLRGSIMYLLILAALRVFRREAGALSIPDLLVVVLVADAAQNALSAEYHSITEGTVLVATIFLWNYALDWLSFRSRAVYRLLHPAPLPLIENGRLQRRNMRQELLTMDDLESQLRQHGIENLADVKLCHIETDGHLSVITYEPGEEAQRPSDKGRGIV
ncbi:MAG: DUF421 domain-containing protein [Gemmatimonadales bacterium]|nr:DUF421 domain-containing protein [Gemmatimonadales bacterium]